MFGAMTTWFSMTAVLSEVASIWKLSSTSESLITIAVQAGFVVGSLFMVVLNLPDRISSPLLFFGASILAGLTTIVTALFVNDFASALTFRFITGIALAGVYSPGLKLISSWFKIRRGMALGLIVGALALGSATPHIFDSFELPSWRLVLVATGIIAISAGILILAFVPEGPYLSQKSDFDPRAIFKIIRNRNVRFVNFGYFGHMWELYAMWAWFSVFAMRSLQESGSMDPSIIASLLTFTVLASGAMGSWLGGVIADKFGRENLILWSLGISGSMAFLIGFTFGGPPLLIWLLGIVWGISSTADSAQFNALITEHSDKHLVGTTLTLQLAVGYTLTIIAIWFVPIFESLVGWQFVFWLLVPGPIIGFISMYRLKSLR